LSLVKKKTLVPGLADDELVEKLLGLSPFLPDRKSPDSLENPVYCVAVDSKPLNYP